MNTMFPTLTSETLSTKAIISAAASAAATVMLVRTIARDYLPHELRHYIALKIKTLISSFSQELTFVIEEYENLNQNSLYKAAELYLQPIIPSDTKRLKLSLPKKENSKLLVSLEKDQEIVDKFNGIILKWKHVSRQVPVKYLPGPDPYSHVANSEHRFYELSFHKKHKHLVLDAYIKHVIEKSKELKEEQKRLKLFTLRQDRMSGRRADAWQSVNLDHPSTFETLAMDLDAKMAIMEDLERFVKRKEFYKRVGKAWKRGYLLFGPPGTGKSSLVAAMANYLKFDVYDLELNEIRLNSELRNLLISTANRSILVVEDIDCSIDLQKRNTELRAMMNHPKLPPGFHQAIQSQITLSGLLNFIDGLWSSCGDERIIIFTTNHKEKIDPALLRPGRMDFHIHMSYCTFSGFKMLATNYLGITEHRLFLEVEELLEITKATPAEVGEQLMKSDDTEVVLRGLIEFLEQKSQSEESKKTESDESKAGNEISAAAAVVESEGSK